MTSAKLLSKTTTVRQISGIAPACRGSHIVIDVIHNGPDDVFARARLWARMPALGTHKARTRAGTYNDYQKMLEIILAGRVGEEMILGEGSQGAGGQAGSDLERATTLAARWRAAWVSPVLHLSFILEQLGCSRICRISGIRKSVSAELQESGYLLPCAARTPPRAVEKVAERLMQVNRVMARRLPDPGRTGTCKW